MFGELDNLLTYRFNDEFDDLGSVEGDNIMTIHQKLDYIMRGGISESPKLMLVSTEHSFNISDIIGVENVGKYSINDFVCVPDFTGLQKQTYSCGMVNSFDFVIQNMPDFSVTYDNTNGDVSITNVTFTLVFTPYNAGNAYTSAYKKWNVPVKVYLLVKTGDSVQ